MWLPLRQLCGCQWCPPAPRNCRLDAPAKWTGTSTRDNGKSNHDARQSASKWGNAITSRQFILLARQIWKVHMCLVYFWQFFKIQIRLLESYRKLQKVNQGLEDKLLRIADKFENEKISLTHNVADLTGQLTEAQMSIAGLQQEAEQYKNDCNLAIRMLQCKPSQFVSQKLESVSYPLIRSI